jgi:hypothetical protein
MPHFCIGMSGMTVADELACFDRGVIVMHDVRRHEGRRQNVARSASLICFIEKTMASGAFEPALAVDCRRWFV